MTSYLRDAIIRVVSQALNKYVGRLADFVISVLHVTDVQSLRQPSLIMPCIFVGVLGFIKGLMFNCRPEPGPAGCSSWHFPAKPFNSVLRTPIALLCSWDSSDTTDPLVAGLTSRSCRCFLFKGGGRLAVGIRQPPQP